MGREGENPDGNERSGGANDGDSFGRLANATRLEIVDALATDETPLDYTALFERVSVDDSGQFNYHLRQLVGEYVRKTDEGYLLDQAGLRAANVIASSSLELGANRQFQRIDSRCGACGSDGVDIGYRAGEGVVRCPDCERRLTRFDFPPAAVETYAPAAFADAFAQRTRSYIGLADDGVCPFCAHSMSTEVEPSAATHPDAVPVVGRCSACPAGIRAPVGLVLSNRPRIQSLVADSGVPFRETPFWEFEWCTFDAPVIRKTDPLVAELGVDVGDESASILVNANVEILELDH
ncbi:helix-turn-helix transcriptional regulator [Halorubellus sp. JP-L1]|uniref:DUF7351 domain-containing protein n=1 Tax=Halorubellus sp. JP-L1 TaxID=2715753 RepID=UPI0014098CA4|nr:helix-turn-helix domain-containing protein [Halorubellus sp. JP-L1]NHN40885.1 helix-turn-helix transcriptional regulator [Halorubellus sp. JP-L1]